MAPSRRLCRPRKLALAASNVDLVARLDAIGKTRLDLGKRDRRGGAGCGPARRCRSVRRRRGTARAPAARRHRRWRRGRSTSRNAPAAAAAVFGDALGIGEREQRADAHLLLARGSGVARAASSSRQISAQRCAMARASRPRGERSRRKRVEALAQIDVVAAKAALADQHGDFGGVQRFAVRRRRRPPCARAAAAAAVAASCRPSSVMRPSPSMAPSSASSAFASVERRRAAADRGRRACPAPRPRRRDRARRTKDRRRGFPAGQTVRAPRSAARPTAGSRRRARCARRGRGADRRPRATPARFRAGSRRHRARSAARGRARSRRRCARPRW